MTDVGDARLVWERHGIASPRIHRVAKLSSGSVRSRAESFRSACLELGGLCQAFATFLSGRADLLPFPYLEELERVPPPFLGDSTRGLPEIDQAGLKQERASLYTRVFRGRLGGRPAVVEVSCEPGEEVRQSAWRAFKRAIAPASGLPENAIFGADVLLEFSRWLDAHADLGKKRRMLENVQQAPTGSLLLIPALVPGAFPDDVLAYEDLEQVCGPSAERAGETGLFVEAVLEQILSLAFVTLDAPWADLVLLDERRVGFRVWPFMEAIPIQHYQSVLQYVASCVAEDSGRAMRMLLRIARHQNGTPSESDLWRQLSALRFEATADQRIPESASKMLEFWKALAAERVSRPLFLDLLHRELMSTFRSAYEPENDRIAPAASAVFNRLVTGRLADVTTSERAREWAIGSSLVALGTVRQAGVLLEQLRDNDFSITIKTETSRESAGPNRRAVGAGISVVLFIAALQGALIFPGSLLGHLSIAACLVFGAAFVFSASHRG